DEAEKARAKAVEAEKDAKAAQAKTAEALTDLQTAQGELERSIREAKKAGYGAYILLANQQLVGGDAAQAPPALDKWLTEARGWEWRLLAQWARLGRQDVPVRDLKDEVVDAAFNRSGRRVAILFAGKGKSDSQLAVYDTLTGERVRAFDDQHS